MNIFSNSKYLHNEIGKICNVLGEKYILVGLEGLHTLVFLTSEVSYLFSSNGSSDRIAEPASSSWVFQDRNETFEWNNSLETIRFIWKNGTPVLLEDLEEGVLVNFDAIFRIGLGYQAILVWIGSKPKSSPVLSENEMMFVKEFVYLPVHCFSFKKGQPTVYVTVEDCVKEIAFTHHVANVDGTQVSSFEELENICQNDKPAVATICKFIKMDRHNYIYIFVCSGLYVGNETCKSKASMKSNFNSNALYVFSQNQPVATSWNSATLHFDIDFHISNDRSKNLAFLLNGKYIVIERHAILNITENYDVPYLGGIFHLYHEYKGKDVYNFLVFKTFPNQETLKHCVKQSNDKPSTQQELICMCDMPKSNCNVIDNKLYTISNKDKNLKANERDLKSGSFRKNGILVDSDKHCNPSLKPSDSNAELTLQLSNSMSNSNIESLPQNVSKSVCLTNENLSFHINYENSPTNCASSEGQQNHNTEGLGPVFQSGRHYIGDLADSMPNSSKENTFNFDLKNEQCSMTIDSKMSENSPKNDMSLTNSGLNWHFEKLEADKPVQIKSETYVNSQMQHNLNSVDIPSQSDVNLSNSNSGKDKKEQLVLDGPQHPNSHLNPEKIELSFGDFQFKNELNNSNPNCDLPDFHPEFMPFLLEYVNILDSLTIEEFFSFMNSCKTTNTSFPCLRKIQGRIYYNEKLNEYFILGKLLAVVSLIPLVDSFTYCYFNKKFVFPSSKIAFNDKTVCFDAVLLNNQYSPVLIYDKDPDVETMISSDNVTLYYNVIGIYKGVDSTTEVKFDIFMNNTCKSISGKPIFIEGQEPKCLHVTLNDNVLLHLRSLVNNCYTKWEILFVVPLKIKSIENIKLTPVTKNMKKSLRQLKETYAKGPSTGINAHHGSHSDGSKLNLLIPKTEIETFVDSETKENKLSLSKSNRELPIPDNTVNLEPHKIMQYSRISETNNLECKFKANSNTVLSLPECNQEYILEALDPVFQSGIHSMGDLDDSMPNASKKKTFYFDLKKEQCSMPSDSKMFENYPQNDLRFPNSGVNFHGVQLEASKPAQIKSESYINSQMQHNRQSALLNSNSGKENKQLVVLDCPQNPNSHLNEKSEKMKLSFGNFQRDFCSMNKPTCQKPNFDLPDFHPEFMSFLLEYVNILDSLTKEEFLSFMKSCKTTNTSFPCLRKTQGRVYYNEKLKQYFLLGKSPNGICLFQFLDLFSSCYFNKKFVFPSSNIVFNDKTVCFDSVLVNNQYIPVIIYDKDPDAGTMIFSSNATHYFNVIGVYKGVDSRNEVKFDIFMNNVSTSISGKPIFIEESSKKKHKGLDFLLNDYVLLHLSSLVTSTCYKKWDILFVVPLKQSSNENIKLTEVSKKMKKRLKQFKETYAISPSTGNNAHHGSYSDGSKLNLLIPKSEIETVLDSETEENKLTPTKSNRELLILDNTINLEPNIVNLDSGISESQLSETNNLECKFGTKSNTVLSLPECNQEYILATASNGHKPISEYLNSTLQPNATSFSDENEALFNGKLNKKEVTEALKDSEPCIEKQFSKQSKTNIKFNSDVEFRTGFCNWSTGCSGGSGVLLEREEHVEHNDSLANLDGRDCRQTSLCSRLGQVRGINSQNVFNSKKMPLPLIKKDNTIAPFELVKGASSFYVRRLKARLMREVRPNPRECEDEELNSERFSSDEDSGKGDALFEDSSSEGDNNIDYREDNVYKLRNIYTHLREKRLSISKSKKTGKNKQSIVESAAYMDFPVSFGSGEHRVVESDDDGQSSEVHDIDSSHSKAVVLTVIFPGKDIKKKKKKKKIKSKKTAKKKQSIVEAATKMDIPVSFESVRRYPINHGEHRVEESEDDGQSSAVHDIGTSHYKAHELSNVIFSNNDAKNKKKKKKMKSKKTGKKKQSIVEPIAKMDIPVSFGSVRWGPINRGDHRALESDYDDQPLPNYYDLMMLGHKKNPRPTSPKFKDVKLLSSSGWIN